VFQVLSLCVYPLPISRVIFTQLSEQIAGRRGTSEMPLKIAQPVIDACVGAVRRMLVVHSFMIDGHLHHGALEAALVEMGFESSSPTARVFLRLFQGSGGSEFVQNVVDSGLDAMVVLTKLSTIKDVALVLSGVRAIICEVLVLNHRHRMQLPVNVVHAMLRSLGDLCANHGMRLAHMSFFHDDDPHERKQLARRLVEGSSRGDSSGVDSAHEARVFSAALRRASVSSFCTCCLVVCGTWSDRFESSLVMIKDVSSLTVKLAEGIRTIEGSNFASKVLLLDLANSVQDPNEIGRIAAGAQTHGAACVIFEMEDNCTWHKQHLMFTKPWVTIPCLAISSAAFKKLKNHVSGDSVGQCRFTMVVSPCMISTSIDSADIRQALQYFREIEGSMPSIGLDAVSVGGITPEKNLGDSGSPKTSQLESLAVRCAALLGVQVRRPRGQKGLRILTLDGGGSRGVAAVELLRALNEALKPLTLSDVFDVVAGTSTGAIVSCAHFLCGYALDDVSRFYVDMAGQVFKDPVSTTSLLTTAPDFARYHQTERTYMQLLEHTETQCPTMKQMREQSEGRPSDGLTLMDAGLIKHAPAMMVLSTLVSATPPRTFLFRSYVPPSDSSGCSGSAYIGTHDARISEACRASTAAPSYFTRYKHSSAGTHVDGGVLANNPVAIALNETLSLARAGMWGPLPTGQNIEFIVSATSKLTAFS
jgi:predicted acylesterase/phospholipase RssA